jgi:putative ABC transport system permease protein
MFKLTLRNLSANKRRLIGTSLAVCLGVAFLAGTFVLGDTMAANFDRLFTTGVGQTDAVVRNANQIGGDVETAQALVPQDVVDRVDDVDGVASSAPSIQGLGQLTSSDGEAIGGYGPPTIAASWIDDDALNSWDLVEGRAPRGLHEIVINQGAADEGDLELGDTTTVQGATSVEARIVGIATIGGEDGLGPSTYVAFSPEGARENILGGRDGATEVLVEADDGVSATELRDRLADDLGGDVQVLTGDELVQEQNDQINGDFLGFLRTFLSVFGGIALLVAAFSINNTFSIIIAQRKRDSALLRAIGASRRQVLGSMVLETLLVGVIASLIGLGAGIGIAIGLKAMFSAFGFSLPAGGLTLKASSLIIAPVVGLLITIVAGIGPSIRGSRVPPLAALRDVSIDRSDASRPRLVIGTLMTVAGVYVVVSAALTGAGGLPIAGLGALLVVAGAVTLGPVVAKPISSVLGRPLARTRGMPGSLARRNAMRNPRRTSSTAAALLVGVGVVSLFTVFAASLKASIDDSVSQSFGGDLVIQSSGFGGGGLSPQLAGAIGELPEVSSATGMSYGEIQLDGSNGLAGVTVADLAVMTQTLDIDPVDGDLPGLSGAEIAVSTKYAEDHDLAVGDPMTARFQDGQQVDMTVGATYDDPELVGDLTVPKDLWADHSIQVIDTNVLVALADGVSVDDGEQAVQAVADRFGKPEVMDRQEYIDVATAGVDGMLTLVYVMLALAIIIALMGIANALSLAIHERTRELGLLRAVGTTRRQMRSMVRWESVLVALLGAVGGIAVGTFLGWALVKAADADGFISVFQVPVGSLAVVLLVGALAGALAAIRPARRAARLDILEAIATS